MKMLNLSHVFLLQLSDTPTHLQQQTDTHLGCEQIYGKTPLLHPDLHGGQWQTFPTFLFSLNLLILHTRKTKETDLYKSSL